MPGVKRKLSFSITPTAHMAKRSRKSKPSRRRRARKSKVRGGRNSINMYNSTNGPVPQRAFIKMKYADRISFSNAVAGSSGAYQFNLNSIFDPDKTGVGHQPYGRDTYETLYNRYRVHKVKVRVTVEGQVTAQMINFMATDNGSGLATWAPQLPGVVMERPHVSHYRSSYDRGAVMTRTILCRNVCGATKAEYSGDDRYQATMGLSPTELIELTIGHICSTTVAVGYDVQLIYFVEFYDPKVLGQS